MKYPCSHKAHEWKEYKATKEPGDGKFPPIKYCHECEEAKKLKGTL